MKKIEWELLEQDQSGYMYRSKVPGGWMVKCVEDVLVDLNEDRKMCNGYEWRSALCFVPDPSYQWLEESKSTVEKYGHEAHCNLMFPGTLNTDEDHCSCKPEPVTASRVAILRNMTDSSMLECKEALVKNDGNIDKAYIYLITHVKRG